MDFRDVSRVAGVVSVAGILASGLVAASATLSSTWPWFTQTFGPFALKLCNLPLIEPAANLLMGAFNSHFLLGIAAVAGLSIAVPWALDIAGKLLDGALTKADNTVERLRTNARDEKIRLQARQQNRQPAVPEYAAAPPAVSHVEHYHRQQDQLPVSGYQRG